MTTKKKLEALGFTVSKFTSYLKGAKTVYIANKGKIIIKRDTLEEIYNYIKEKGL